MSPRLPLSEVRSGVESAIARARLVRTGVVAAVFAAVVILVLAVQLGRAREAARAAGLAEANARARADTSRALAGQEIAALRKIYGDSVAGATRLTVQERQRSDALDHALGQQRAALASLTASVRRLEVTIAGAGPVTERPADPADPAAGVIRSQRFEIRQTPYRGTADVSLPAPPGVGSLRLALTVDPAPIALRLGCSDSRNAAGIRDARATATGPDWLTLRIDSTSADPEVCNAERARFPWLPWLIAGAEGALLLLGR